MTSHHGLNYQAPPCFWTKAWINTGKAMQKWNPSCNTAKQMRVAREIGPRYIQLSLRLGNARNLRSSEAEDRIGEHRKNYQEKYAVPKDPV